MLPFDRRFSEQTPGRIRPRYSRGCDRRESGTGGRQLPLRTQPIRRCGNAARISAIGSVFVEVVPGVNASRPNGIEHRNSQADTGSGHVSTAGRLLERPYVVARRCRHGHGIGSKQTVPTLNLATECRGDSGDGVYITRTHDLNSRPSVGVDHERRVPARPLTGEGLTIETFLLSPFDGDDSGAHPRRVPAPGSRGA